MIYLYIQNTGEVKPVDRFKVPLRRNIFNTSIFKQQGDYVPIIMIDKSNRIIGTDRLIMWNIDADDFSRYLDCVNRKGFYVEQQKSFLEKCSSEYVIQNYAFLDTFDEINIVAAIKYNYSYSNDSDAVYLFVLHDGSNIYLNAEASKYLLSKGYKFLLGKRKLPEDGEGKLGLYNDKDVFFMNKDKFIVGGIGLVEMSSGIDENINKMILG